MATVPVTKTVFDLASFDEITLVKNVELPSPYKSVHEAIESLKHNEAGLLEMINSGLAAQVKRAASQSPEDWHTYDDEGKVNGPFTGIMADQKKVNTIVLSMAKTVFGFNKDMNKEQKREAKEKAKNFVKSNEVICEGLRKNAAVADDDEDEA